MAEGRWADDAYPSGMTPTPLPPAPRLERWMKWTWPAMFLAAFGLTAVIGPWGWLVAMAAWFATCVVPYWFDNRALDGRNRSGPRTL